MGMKQRYPNTLWPYVVRRETLGPVIAYADSQSRPVTLAKTGGGFILMLRGRSDSTFAEVFTPELPFWSSRIRGSICLS